MPFADAVASVAPAVPMIVADVSAAIATPGEMCKSLEDSFSRKELDSVLRAAEGLTERTGPRRQQV
jgi:hypothetical protein